MTSVDKSENIMKIVILIVFITFNCFSQIRTKKDALLDTLYSYMLKNKDREFREKIYDFLLRNPNDTAINIKTFNLLGQFHNRKDNLDSASYYANKVLRLTKDKKDTFNLSRRAGAFMTLGVLNKKKGLVENAVKWHIKGVEASMRANDSSYLFIHKHGLAEIYRNRKEYDKALELYEFCLLNKYNPDVVLGSYINIGVLLAERKKIEKSEYYFNQGLFLAKKAKNLVAEAIIYLNLAENYHYEFEDYDKAIVNYNKVIEISKANNFIYYQSMAEIGIIGVYILQNKLLKAERELSNKLTLAKEKKLFKLQNTIYENYENLYLKQGDYKKAFFSIKEKVKLLDSVQKIQRKEEIRVLEAKFNSEQKERELVYLKNESKLRENELKVLKKNKKLITIFSIVFFVLMLVIIIVYYQKWRVQKKTIVKQAELNKEKVLSILKDQDLKIVKANLKGQLKERKEVAKELHDNLGNTIAGIKLQVNAIKTNNLQLDSVIEQLDDLYGVVRSFSHDLLVKKYVKDNYVKQIKGYLTEVGKASNIKTYVHLFPEEEINELDVDLQYDFFSMIQELVTNTIKHANANQVSLEINVLEKSLNIIFEDDGIGFVPNKKVAGIGLKNLKDRIVSKNGSINIDSLVGRGTIINIEIPM